MRTVDIVKGRWPFIFQNYGIEMTGRTHKNCPICGGKKKFRIDDKEGSGSWICVCGAGDGFKLLTETTGKDFKTLAKEIDVLLGNVYSATPIAPRRDYQGELFNYWRTLRPIKGTSVERYLQSRGIWRTPARAMKMVGNDDKSEMFCVATNDQGQPLMIHRTYLHGDGKAKIDAPKRTKAVDEDRKESIDESIAIRLFESQTCLGIAEGIETALSAHQLYECAVWSTMNSSFMKKFRAPAGVEHLIIFADSDNNGTGHASAFVCGHANILANNDVKRVTIRWPDKGDFADVLNCAQKVHEWRLTK